MSDTITTGSDEQRGTWVHPQVTLRSAMWYSATFAVEVTIWVEE